MRIRRTAAAIALTLAAALPAATAPLAAAAAAVRAPDFPTGTVTAADGRTLFADPAGRSLQLRGFNVDKYDEATEADLRSIVAHGFNLIRLDITWARLEPAPGRYDAAELARLQQLMGWADRYGLLVLVDFHQDVYGPAFGGGQDGVPAWATDDDGLPFTPDPDDWFAEYFEPSVQAAFTHLYDDPALRRAQTDFYTHIARTLRGDPALLGYDLFNEPSGPFDGDPTDPAVQVSSVAALETGRLALMYRRLIAAVRAVDTRSWLFVEPTVLVGEGVPTLLPGFRDPRPGAARIGYAPHFYDTAVEDGGDWNPSDGFIQAYTAAVTAYPRAHRMPVVVGEWGPPDADTPGNTELVQAQVTAMEGFAGGWTMWYWGEGTGGYTPLDPQGAPHPGDAPVFGPYATAVAGLPLAEAYTPATGGYTLRYTVGGSGANTRIVLPPTAYPAGARLRVAGAGRALVRLRQPRGGTPGSALIAVPGARPGAAVTVTLTPA
ncbi:glycoside hydrolase family 5 protein [Streptacidiphilus sp. PB12-B1b]|uniref:cellulase family glycosylhydrolase n=1 Tax=Streptacidiphilus sp. PB12-B1b TaxID=2705012 RepID=UPI0015FBD71C|nr:cellulase family glycosylhydrolase [Streptacidiphilus sp. PB12-B1b]QMU76456.1 glycoside hydrolase family 5 protein [Streptacidiphilus sp. PB12-B1b]